MAYNEDLAERVRAALADRIDVEEKKMFGGPSFMVAGQMCCAVVKGADDKIIRYSRSIPPTATGPTFPSVRRRAGPLARVLPDLNKELPGESGGLVEIAELYVRPRPTR